MQANNSFNVDPATCAHEEFEVLADVNRMAEKEGGKISQCMLDIAVRCSQCGTPLHFVGVPQGLSFARPMASPDGLELRAPLAFGPIPPADIQTIEVAAEKYGDTDTMLDSPIIASSDDKNP